MEKRIIERHLMEEFIHLNGGEGVIPARTVNVSRNGMKVVVNRPYSFDEVYQVSVSLPGTGGNGIPCRVRRSEMGSDQWEIGLEFDGENDARMLLVERWLESLENRRVQTESAPTESRGVPRTRCTIDDIRCLDKKLTIISAEDISVDGMLIRATGDAVSGDIVDLSMSLPGTGREIAFRARIAYIVDNGNALPFSAGISVMEIRETDRNRLQKYILDIASGAAMLEYHRLLELEEPPEEFRVGRAEAARLISILADEALTVNLLDDVGLRILETRIENVNDGEFQTPAPQNGGETSFFSFTRSGSSFSFSADRLDWHNGIGRFRIPQNIYRGEKRAGRRGNSEGSIELFFSRPEIKVSGQLVDSSRRGILCEVPVKDFAGFMPNTGDSLEVVLNGERLPCEIRHIVEFPDTQGDRNYRIGLETGIQRRKPRTTIYDEAAWKKEWNGEPYKLKDSSLVLPERVFYTDHDGRKIAALVHLLDKNRPCIAVVVPPAFGKKKEALAPLALTLVAYFASAGENIAVLRYDGIDRPGESDNANVHARRGYEMIGYRIDQGYTDLEATMRWVKNNPVFKAEKTVLISSSMASLDARRLQATPGAPRADYWISLMGVSSAQGALVNILGGLDVVANHRMGIPIGTMGMLGQLIDMDRMAADMTRLGYATASDAREAMSRIESPVTWLYGAFDKWMIPEEIRDIMSILAPGDREIIEIPTAHNLRTSDDAVSAFQLISDAILRRLKGRSSPMVTPDKEQLLNLLTREREHVTENEKLDTRRYWKGYLVGETDGEEGYDFYAKLTEFQEFLEMEARLLNPKPGESIADMGCGTGLVSRQILRQLAETGEKLSGTRFTAVDLVDEALAKARGKYLELCLTHKNLKDVENHWIPMNLEPDPLAGLRRLIAGEKGGNIGINELRDRVNGLRSDTVDRLSSIPESTMGRVLRGSRLTLEELRNLENMSSPGDLLLLKDLNLGARFIRGEIDEEDLKPNRRQGRGSVSPERLRIIRSSDLMLACLNYGDWARSGTLPIGDESFDAISASLFLSYLYAPGEAVREFARMLKPGGRLLLSTMKPDSDISGIFTRYIKEQIELNPKSEHHSEREKNLREARTMLNEAASLFSLEEDGWFRFFDQRRLADMMQSAGFTRIHSYEGLGCPTQAIIVLGYLES